MNLYVYMHICVNVYTFIKRSLFCNVFYWISCIVGRTVGKPFGQQGSFLKWPDAWILSSSSPNYAIDKIKNITEEPASQTFPGHRATKTLQPYYTFIYTKHEGLSQWKITDFSHTSGDPRRYQFWETEIFLTVQVLYWFLY